MSKRDIVIDIHGLTKAFEDGRINALNGIDLQIERGEWVAIVGPSGCGKSTLLHLIASLDHPDGGQIIVDDHDLAKLRDINHYRSHHIGMIFQLHNLLPSLTASENVQVPMFELGISGRERKERAERGLADVGLAGKEKQRPVLLSGGERQRIAIARALANGAPILLADEPTGNLDSQAGRLVLDLLERIRLERDLTIVMVTHDPRVAERADRLIQMLDGRVVTPAPQLERRDIVAAVANW
jgi:putative ABC transport system ATP-binding protein